MKFFLVLFSVILLTGCLNYEEKLKLNEDGSGKISIHYWTSEKLSGLFDTVKTGFVFNEKYIEKNFSAEGCKITDKEIFTENGNKHILIKINFNHLNDLNNLGIYNNKPFELIDGAKGQKVLNRKISPVIGGEKIDSEYYFRYEYDLPGIIITDNSLKKNNNTLIWEFPLTTLVKGKTLSASFEISKSTDYKLVYYFLAFLAVILIVIILLKIGKKLRNTKK